MQSAAARLAPVQPACRVLYVGSGNSRLTDSRELMELFGDYDEVRLDICKEYKPDIVADMTDMGDIGQYDAVVSRHSLEHLHQENVVRALGEFLRVLVPGGLAVIYVPDLEGITPTDDVVYESAAGPITGHDMFYGYAPYVADNPYMAHHSGFTEKRLTTIMENAGFAQVIVKRAWYLQLLAVGVK